MYQANSEINNRENIYAAYYWMSKRDNNNDK